MSFSHQTECLNCQTKLVGEHCHDCGQEKVHRIGLGQLIKIVQRGLIEYKSPLLQLFLGLTFSPAKTCREYLDGKRIKYFNPIRYTFWLITALLLVSTWREVSLFAPVVAQVPDENVRIGFAQAMDILQNSLVYLYFFMPIFLALVTKLFFFKYKYSVVELYLVHLLCQAHMTILSIVALLFGVYENLLFFTSLSVVSIFYTSLTLSRLHLPQTKSNYIRGFLAGIISITIGGVVIQFLAGVISGFFHSS